MRKLLAMWMKAQQARADREVLARLGAHTLTDIGLETWNGTLAERLHADRQRQILRIVAGRIGAY